MKITTGGGKVSLVLNAHGEVANFLNATQFVTGHSEYACGPFAVAHVKFTTGPNVDNRLDVHQLQNWAFHEYSAWIGPDNPSDTMGSSIDNMHHFYSDAGLSYWEMPISANSDHNQDIARIKAALSAGYIVVATVTEASVFDVGLGKNPYWWGPSGNHVIVYSGTARSGNLLVEDTANVLGALQGNNWTQPGPREYLIANLDNSYGAILQSPWLKKAPNNDPLTWPQGFNAQNEEVPNVIPNPNFDKEASDCWASTMKGWTNPPPIGTGIFNSWKAAWQAGKQYGPPLTSEYHSVNMAGQAIIVQEFAHARCEWDGQAHWYSINGNA